jgi:hypothetical protein
MTGLLLAALPLRAAEVFVEIREPLADPAQRQRVVAELRTFAETRRADAQFRARQMGLPLRVEQPGGAVRELMGFDGDQPVYFTTFNANAAISTGANLLQAAPYLMDGAGDTVGIWDEGSVRATHRELAGRVTVMDNAAVGAHATHVGGIIAASGVTPSAKGMAPAVNIASYDWNSDLSEMTAAGVSYPCEPGKIQISNHSYGLITGWQSTGTSPKWRWYGSKTTASSFDGNFGKYNTPARDVDNVANSLPYYQIVVSAGNDRDHNPASGESVALSSSTATNVSYNSALHPPGDGVYRNGYDTLNSYAVAKNVLTIGSVRDAVTSGARDPSKAYMETYSSWGPTDDGRIKPDLVANGYSLYSSLSGSDAAYGSMSGTSMSGPNAAGTAQLVFHLFGSLFPGHALRASTLKALLIHTADDLGTAGPDYAYGWGLLNGKGAAELLTAYRANAGTRHVIENRVTAARTRVSTRFTWDGASPIRATLCWTDPAGASTTTDDSRTARLVNNLDLSVTGPGGATFLPWVMPFVGNWGIDAYGRAATTGSNSTDTVEQVLIAAPPAAGVYTATVSYRGTLTDGRQIFSLILSGVAPDQQAPAPVLSAVSPGAGSGALAFTFTGDHFLLGAEVKLRKRGEPDVPGVNVEVRGDTVGARIDTSGMAGGWWRATVTNPDGRQAELWDAFAVPTPLWTEDFETNNIADKGWTTQATIGASQWALSSAKSTSPTRSMFSPGVATRSDTSLVSPGIELPADTATLQLSFRHDYTFMLGDAGVLEFSLDGGDWFDVTGSGSGAAFVANGYTDTVLSSQSPLQGRRAWAGASSAFKSVVVQFADLGKYAGRTLRIRWRLGTNNNISSAGWYVDDVTLSTIGAPPGPPRGTVMRLF